MPEDYLKVIVYWSKLNRIIIVILKIIEKKEKTVRGDKEKKMFEVKNNFYIITALLSL